MVFFSAWTHDKYQHGVADSPQLLGLLVESGHVQDDMLYCPGREYPTGYWYWRQAGYAILIPGPNVSVDPLVGSDPQDPVWQRFPALNKTYNYSSGWFEWRAWGACAQMSTTATKQWPHQGTGVNVLRLDGLAWWLKIDALAWPNQSWSPPPPGKLLEHYALGWKVVNEVISPQSITLRNSFYATSRTPYPCHRHAVIVTRVCAGT